MPTEKKYGIQSMFKDIRGKIIFTKSEEERRICDWLSIHGVSFAYEDPYEYKTSDDQYKQYRPDFSIYTVDDEGNCNRIYFEHFAINKEGNVPYWFGSDYNDTHQDEFHIVGRWEEANRAYNEGIKWKKNLHGNNGTKLIYTTSAMFHDNTIWTQLEEQLKSNGVNVTELTPDELYSKLVMRDKSLERSVYKLLEQFATLQKSNLVSVETLIDQAGNANDERSVFILSELMRPFIIHYNDELKRNGLIDYTDAILEATRLSKTGAWLDYEYILVDEFQDISKDRYLFLKSLRKDNGQCFTKLFCVGDDWQSIYRFSGSDMSLFYDFEEYFGFTKHSKIETTYRFNNPLLKLSSDFIQQNPNQVTKDIREINGVDPDEYERLKNQEYELNSLGCALSSGDVSPMFGSEEEDDKKLEEVNNLLSRLKYLEQHRTTLSTYHYVDDEDEKYQVEQIIKRIPLSESILIIARYNYDSGSLGFRFTPQDADKKVINLTLSGRKIRFMSVHGSKGLEADHVILINCNRGINGFPSLIEDDPILSFVLSDKDQFENSEERRVFYVAITRAKKKMYVFYDEKRPSCFVEELESNKSGSGSVYIPCPTCGHGHLYPIKEGVNRYKEWVAVSCTNKSSGCPYFKLMDKSQYIEMQAEFNTRNDNDSVQKHAKEESAKIKSFIRNIAERKQKEAERKILRDKYVKVQFRRT